MFTAGPGGTLRRRATSVAGEYRLTDDWTLQAGIGASIGGDLESDDVHYDLGPGPLAVVSAAYRVLDGRDRRPFLLFSMALSASTVLTAADTGVEARMTAFDARFGLTAGKVFLHAVVPYASVRAFGGPIIWRRDGDAIGGTDRYHFQVGGGALVTTRTVDAFFEIMPLGERAMTFGAALSF